MATSQKNVGRVCSEQSVLACGWTDGAVDIDRLEYFRPSVCPSVRGVLIDSALNEQANETMTFSGKGQPNNV